MWWWLHEFFNGPTERPKWYSPVPRPDQWMLMGERDEEDGEDKDEDDERQATSCTEAADRRGSRNVEGDAA